MRRTLAGAAVLAVLAAGCSGVPTSSKPQVIGAVQGAPVEPVKPTNTPQPGAGPRTIVQEFLRANVTEPIDRGAHEFLTPEEQRNWSERTVTILDGSVENADVGVEDGNNPPHAVGVQVSGKQIGSLAADGTYSPAPPGSGGSGQPWSYQYGLDPVNGQYRISDAPPSILVVYADEFALAYRSVRLYFYDQSEQHLVPDVRYTALESPQDVASWELRRLIAGPSSELADAVHSELPNPPAGSNSSVTIASDGSMRIELPGSSRLDGDTKKRVAAELFMTFASSQPQLALTITDGGAPIDIPDFPPQITKATLEHDPVTADLINSTDPVPVFYLDARHRLVNGETGQAVSGPVGGGRYDLTSVAVASVKPEDDYYVAATIGSGSQQTFWIGRTQTGLSQLPALRGALTRPSWAAGQKEAWVSNGATLYRVFDTEQGWRVWPVPVAGLPDGGRITALRLSPEGSRIAMIVQGPAGLAQLWTGTIVRSGSPSDASSVRVDSAQAIMPPAYHLSDVAWSDDMTLWVVGTDDPQRRSHGIWSVTLDGANIRDHSSAGLPQGADTITTASGLLPWVSAGGYVYQLSSEWQGPNNRTTPGTAPVYVE